MAVRRPAADGLQRRPLARHGPRYSIDPDAAAALRAHPGISSIQITFDVHGPPERHSMPPGGFRLAIVNCWDLRAGRAVRARLRRLFTPGASDGAGRDR